MLKRAEQSARNKQEFELTAVGKKAISSEAKRLLAEFTAGQPHDAESVLRLAALALSQKRDRVAASLLRSTALARRQLTKLKWEERAPVDTMNLASIYRTMNEACATARSKAEAEALIALADQLSPRKVRKG